MSPRPNVQTSATVRVRSRNGPHAVTGVQVRSIAIRMLRALSRPDAELSVLLVDDALIRELNRSYRGADKPTDVLSFSMLEGDFSGVHPGLLGDVVISIPTCVRQAKLAKRGAMDEVAHLLAHGILHLLGHDHDTRQRERIMVMETERLVDAAGDLSHAPARTHRKK